MRSKILRRIRQISLSIFIMFISALMLQSKEPPKVNAGEGQTAVIRLFHGETITLEVKTGNSVHWESSPDGINWEFIVGIQRSGIYLISGIYHYPAGSQITQQP